MLASVKSYALEGLNGYKVDVEVDVNNGVPGVETVGLASTATKESKERVRAAIKNSGLPYPVRRITVNLAPAETKKEGASLDLPIAVGLLVCAEAVTGRLYKDFVMIGELALNGALRHVNGVMPRQRGGGELHRRHRCLRFRRPQRRGGFPERRRGAARPQERVRSRARRDEL